MSAFGNTETAKRVIKGLQTREENRAKRAGSASERWKRWQAADIALLFKLRDEDELDWDVIAKHFPDRLRAQIIARYHYDSRLTSRILEMPDRTKFTPEQAADRDARAAGYDARNATQTFFGDPPIGFSALERRQPGRQQPSLPTVNILSADTPSLDSSIEEQMFRHGESALRASGDAR